MHSQFHQFTSGTRRNKRPGIRSAKSCRTEGRTFSRFLEGPIELGPGVAVQKLANSALPLSRPTAETQFNFLPGCPWVALQSPRIDDHHCDRGETPPQHPEGAQGHANMKLALSIFDPHGIVCTYYRTCPFPTTSNLVEVSSASAKGPRQCSFWVLIPISAPKPNSAPSEKRVEAFQ